MRSSLAIRSLILSFGVTCFLGYACTEGLTNPHSILRKIPDWVSFVLAAVAAVAYLVAVWWAFRGFRTHVITALVSLAFCALGLGVYVFAVVLQVGHGKAGPGQYDHDFSTLPPSVRGSLEEIAADAGTNLQSAVFSEHWHLAEPVAGFKICVQKGHVTALNFSNHPIKNLARFSELTDLGDLYLLNCELKDLSGMKLEKLDRLDVSNNRITDLKTLSGCPNLRWLTARDNRLETTDGLDRFSQLMSSDFSGNPIR